jgi:hypothetical protein
MILLTKMGSSSLKWTNMRPFRKLREGHHSPTKRVIFPETGDLSTSLARKSLLSGLLKRPLRDTQ